MGREIRRVPPNWESPVTKDAYGRDRIQPMYCQTFDEVAADWLETFDRMRAGNLTDFERECYPHGVLEWANDETPPDPKYYRSWSDDEATWYQVWETVSEGTPVSPAFETQDELIEYLAKHGDFWDQKRCHEPDWERLWGGKPGVSGWGRQRAERFVMGPGWAPSFVVQGGKVMSGVEAVTQDTTP